MNDDSPSSAAARPVWAAFDLPLDPRHRYGDRLRGAFSRPPRRELITADLRQVADVVDQAEAAAAAGAWVVGGLTYEAGSAWDSAQRTHRGDGPLAHFEVYDTEPEDWPAAAPSATPSAPLNWFPAGQFTHRSPADAIAAVLQHIAAGDCYQVNLAGRMATVSDEADLYPLFAALAARQPSGYAVFLRSAGVASVSPELFFHLGPDATVLTEPMKGTAPKEPGAATSLVNSAKDRAENLMIVDLLRNDLGRVCRPGSVSVDSLFDLVELPTVWQMVSSVSGKLAVGKGLADTFAALFPCGSVTGAPKIRAMELIATLEATLRGWYCGALGVIRPGGEATFNVAIRTVESPVVLPLHSASLSRPGAVAGGNLLHCGVGSGIVADSEVETELAEWRAKTRFLGGDPLAALETMLLTDGRFPHGPRHRERLARTNQALALGIDLAAVDARLAVLAAEHPVGSFRVRLLADALTVTATASPAPATEVPVRLALAAEPMAVEPLAAVIRHKTSWRIHYDRLREHAGPRVFDVICYTPEGRLTECTWGNLALELDGRWVTPPADVGLLPGVERAARLEAGLLVEAELWVHDLAQATALAFCNGTRGWLPAVLVE